MFAFAIYNIHTKALFIARDIFGIKPLFYTIVKNELVFASEIKALFEYPGVEKKFNEQCLSSYLAFQYLSLIHISEPTRQAEISYAVFCLKKKKPKNKTETTHMQNITWTLRKTTEKNTQPNTLNRESGMYSNINIQR